MMTDITSLNLNAAILDQKVAGAFAGKTYAFVPVVEKNGWALGVAVLNEPGYSPIGGLSWARREDAKHWADGMNEHIGLSPDQALDIVCSTMGKRRV
jgi:hypothetical protein